MHPINQYRLLSAFAAKVLVLTFLSWILILPVPVRPSEGPAHSPQYAQLQNSIAALSAEVNSIASTIGTLKNLQGRTPQTAHHQSHHLQTTIQGLTKKIDTLQTQVQGLGGNLTHLTGTVDALALEIQGRTPDTGVTETISTLSERVGNLAGKVQSLTSQQDSHVGKLEVAVYGLLTSLFTLFARWLVVERPTKKKDRAKERLEKFYAPVLGRLQANEDIWEKFKNEALHTKNLKDPKAILSKILEQPQDRDKWLSMWVAAMEGIFRHNNEAAEKTILEHSGHLRPDDVAKSSAFVKARKDYLLHVQEFKTTLHHWDQARKDLPLDMWYARCVQYYRNRSPFNTSSYVPTMKEQVDYFHPTSSYPEKFLETVRGSYNQLMDEAGLAKKGWFGRLFDRFPNWWSAQTKKEG